MGFEHRKKHGCPAQTCNQPCESENICSKQESTPDGVSFIPGSGKLVEKPCSAANTFQASSCEDFLRLIEERCVCPNVYNQVLCIGECCQFAALSNISFINGDLIINDPCDVDCPPKYCGTDPCSFDLLDIFPNLVGVNGSIYVVGTNYRRITGFERLRYVTGSIVFANNTKLVQIPTFPSLLSVSGKPAVNELEEAFCYSGLIVIVNNRILRKVAGFESLRQVQKGIIIADNSCLTQICGFIHLYRTSNILIADNRKLSKIIGFCYIDTINNNLIITNNNNRGVRDLVISAFLALETVQNLIIAGNKYLRTIKFDSLVTAGKFIVRGNPNLEAVCSSLNTVDELILENNKSLKTISFPCLTEVVKYILINANCSLLCLDTFEELKRVGKIVIIADNQNLVDLKGFGKLKYIGSNCLISDQESVNLCKGDICSCDFGLGIDWEDEYEREQDCTCEPPEDPEDPEDPEEPIIGRLAEGRQADSNKSASSKRKRLHDLLTQAKEKASARHNTKGKGKGKWHSKPEPVPEQSPILPPAEPQQLPPVAQGPGVNGECCQGGDDTCSITDLVQGSASFFDAVFEDLEQECVYELPNKFFRSLCKTDKDCSCVVDEEDNDEVPVVTGSLVIYRNTRLRAIGGFGLLKHTEGSIYIIDNFWLHTINSFGQLALALDIWIRNNESLKYVIAFGNLITTRNFVVYDTPCLLELNNLKSLECAQTIAIEAKFAKAVKLPKCAIPTVLGYIIYYCFAR